MTSSDAVLVRRAADAELEATVRLRWLWTIERGRPAGDESDYVTAAAAWARSHGGTHLPHVAVHPRDGVIGMAWLALTPRVPTVDGCDRWSGDLQSCYVMPEHRNRGIGGDLVGAILATAAEHGVEHVTVHTSPDSVQMYARNGFRANGRLLWADVARSDG
jgi:GNAT superfamily N-acetyltransferase